MGAKAIRILHAEDDPLDTMLINEMILDDVGSNAYDIVHVDSLKDTLTSLKSQGFDAVLLDLNLKDVRGMDNVRAIKEENPDLPVVVLSGVNREDLALKAIENGAQEYLVKGNSSGNVIRLAINSSIRRKSIERKFYQQANYDELTGLPNLRMFQSLAAHELGRAQRWQERGTLMFMDLDKFKRVNDTLGHDTGNQLLQKAAERMKHVLRSTDILARFGGDEFILMTDDHSMDQQEAARMVAEKLLHALSQPFHIDHHMLEIGASIGIAFYPAHGQDLESLMRSADNAMYAAKQAGGLQYAFGTSPA